MLSVSSISQSTLSTAQASMEVAVGRVASSSAANASAANAQRDRTPVVQAAQVEASVEQTASTEADPWMDTDLVGLLQEKNASLANLAVFRNTERQAGGLISLNS